MWPSVIAGLFLFTTGAFAEIGGAQLWARARAPEKAKLLAAYRAFFAEVGAQEKLGEWEAKRASLLRWPIESAWAEIPSRMNCVFAGWPSVRTSTCSSPARSNPSYSRGPCSANQLHCQPLLFGEGLCADMATASQRSLAFSQCEMKFQQARPARTAASVVDGIINGGHETELTDLLSFADRICAQGAQASSGMCRKLEAKVAQVRSALEARPNTSVGATSNLAAGEGQQLISSITNFLTNMRPLVALDDLQGNCVLRRDNPVGNVDVVNALGTPDLGGDPGPEGTDTSTAVLSADTSSSVDAAAVVRDPANDQVSANLAPAPALFSPTDFVNAANSSQLEYVGRGPVELRGSFDSCAYQNAQVVILYMPCNRVAGRVSFKIIAKSGGTLDVSVDPRQGGVAAPAMLAMVQSRALPGTATFNQIKNQVEGGDQDSRCVRTPAVTRCIGSVASRQADWESASSEFVGRAGEGWSNLLRTTDQNLAAPNQ